MKLSRRKFLISTGAALAASGMPAWGAPAAVLTGAAFGASWTLVAKQGFDEAALRAAIAGIVAEVDRAMSPFRPDSELSRFNRTATTGWQELSAETRAVVAEGLRVAALTDNAFNPTVGPLVARHGFGPISRGSPGLPGEVELSGEAVRKARPELSLDLCGIAKGHALDRMAAACKAHGLSDFLIELGGEVFAEGRHPAGRGWQVAVEHPGGGGLHRAASLDGAALATSGNSVNSYVHGGRRYSHIVDPATGGSSHPGPASVTVAAATAVTADALATALFAMGPQRGPAFAARRNIEALFLLQEEAGVAEIPTGGFEARILA